MTIKIIRNEEGNCITFEGTSVPAYFNACLSGQVSSLDNTKVDIKNNIRSKDAGRDFFEFSGIPYTEFLDADGNSFVDAQSVADYITLNGNVSAQTDISVAYLGAYDADTNTPDITTDKSTFNNSEWYFVTVAGTRVFNAISYDLNVNDQVRFNHANQDWDVIRDTNIKVGEIESSSLDRYDIHVDADYTGSVRTGSSVHPYNNINTAISSSNARDKILVKGSNIISSAITLPHELNFYGVAGSEIKYASYNDSNGDIFNFEGADTEKFTFENIIFRNAGGYALLIKKTTSVELRNCRFYNNGWDGTQLNTVLDSSTSGLLGYDSNQVDLQNFYAGSSASNGGAVRLQECRRPLIRECRAEFNFRGFRIQDCGVNGGGFVIENQSINNIESGIYLAVGSLGGCQNITVAINYSAYNANNGLLAVGGLNNKFSQNEVYGNWNAGLCAWGSANLTLRDCGLYDNNRSQYNGIGNNGDAMASIGINDSSSFLAVDFGWNEKARFLAEILDTQVHYTGLGSNTNKVGIYLSEEMGDIPNNDKNIIKIDDVGFIGQDYAIDFSDVDLSNLRVSLGDNSYQTIGIKAVNEPDGGGYFELPFSNHSMDLVEADFSVNNTGNIIIKEGPTGSRINPYNVNELRAEAYGTDIKVMLKDSNKIQFKVPVSGASIDGTLVNSVLSQALVQLNDLFTNTTGFSSGGNPVTNFVLAGNNLTLTLQDGTSYTVDVTTLGVDENKFVTSGALNGSDLELTMNDSSVITIDATNMINGSQLPAMSNDWFISYGTNAEDEVESPSVVAIYENQQPFYNGDFLERGEEYVWTHDDNGYYVLGIYTGDEETSDEVEVTYAAKWSNIFRFTTTGTNRVSESSDGTDVGIRYATGYNLTSNTVLALAYDIDNYLKLYDISSDSRILIGQSNTALVGDSQIISFGGQNQPNAKFPIMIKRYSEWTLVHDFDNSETSIIDGLEEDSVIKSNISINPGEKFMVNFNFGGRAQRFGINYTGASSGVTNAPTTIDSSFSYGTAEQIVQQDDKWDWNVNASHYNASGPNWSRGNGVNLGMISFVYNNDNSLDLYSEDLGEVIATRTVDLDGAPIHFYYGVNESTTVQYIPSISKQTIGAGSQPITTFAPDISDQSFDITEGQSFNIQIALDAGSDIVNIYGEEDAPSWAVLNQSTGYFSGTAPAWTDSASDTHVISCKAANALGGITNFNVTLNVVELVYTNTKSLQFEDGVSSYLGGNAALVTALERASNGSGSGDAWTIAFWYKGSTSNTGQTLFYFGGADTVNTGHIEIKQTNHNGLKRIRIRYGSTNNYIQLTTPSGSINPSNWQHILVAYDGGTTGVASGSLSDYYSRFSVYIDGSLQTTSNTHSNSGYAGSIVGQNFRFGRFASGNYAKDVLLNQLAIWDSDQSSNISGLYNNGATQDISVLQASAGNMNASYLEPDHYYEIEESVSNIEDLIGTAHFVGYNFSSTDLVNDAP